MQEVTKYPAGTFSWVDLSTGDTDGARAFYTGLFGWTAEELPVPDGVYTMFHLHGKPVAAMNAMREDEAASGHSPYWSSYVTVYDLDARTARAAELGGQVIAPPFEVMGAGRMAVLQDPTGAFISLWEPISHIGASYVNVPGSLVWNELISKDVDRAAAFYSALFDWSLQEGQTTTGLRYVSAVNNGRSAGGMMPMQPEWGEMPSHWAIYFAVDDVEAAAAKVTELGGRVHMPPTSAGDVGTFTMVSDPQGGMFYIIQMTAADPPPQAG